MSARMFDINATVREETYQKILAVADKDMLRIDEKHEIGRAIDKLVK